LKEIAMTPKFLVPVALALGLLGCQATNPNAGWGRVDIYNRSAISGAKIRVEDFYQVNIDCSNKGTPKLRIVSPPAGGVLSAKPELSFTSFKADNPRARCNTRRSPVLAVYYSSRPGFSGLDSAKYEIFWVDGDVWTYTLNVNVR
jgi:hypothetical protein